MPIWILFVLAGSDGANKVIPPVTTAASIIPVTPSQAAFIVLSFFSVVGFCSSDIWGALRLISPLIKTGICACVFSLSGILSVSISNVR